jgi:hypothetical protein
VNAFVRLFAFYLPLSASIAAAAVITPTNNFFPYSGNEPTGAAGNGVVATSASAGVAWTAVSNVSWLSIVTGTSGIGNGSVTFSVAANLTGAQRVGTLTIAGQTFTVTQLGPPPVTGSVPIVEYRNSAQDDYFITADPAEQQALDVAAQAGAVWSRTGMSFNSGGTASVYRFIYRSPTGVNTHFYTVNTNEQSGLLANFPIWVLESPVAFYLTAAPTQTCPAGTVPVYRAAQEQTGSHRFATSQSAINEVLARGWTNEGVAFCAPSTDVIVNFVTTTATPLNPGFNGFNNNLYNAVAYYDTNFQQILTTLSPGWLRFPGGTDSEAFDWTSGTVVSAWVDALATNSYQHDINAAAQPVVAGKGGASFSDFARMATNVGGAKIIVSVNAFTDTPQSAQAFARYALTNHIPVAAWELANEPYTWINSGAFFTDATDYATKMKPYRDAIKAADPDAVVALYFSEAGHPDTHWDNALASYSPKYWDAVTYHEYVYPGNLTTFDDLMAAANGNLFSNTTSHVTDYLMPKNNPGVPYLISEVSPSAGHGGVLLGTLYGGIYSAEFALRMSTLPQVKYVASFQMLSNAGIDETNDNLNVVRAAYNSGTTINTSSLNFGFFLSAQAAGEAVANGALHNSIGVYATTTTGGPTAPTNGGGSIPAVYAQAYDGGNGKRYVVLTNKGDAIAVAQIMQNGVVLTNQMLMTFVTGTNPGLVNTHLVPNNVQIQTQTVTTPGALTIPPYSVVRLEW